MGIGDRLSRALDGVSYGLDMYVGLKDREKREQMEEEDRRLRALQLQRAEEDRQRQIARQAEQDRLAADARAQEEAVAAQIFEVYGQQYGWESPADALAWVRTKQDPGALVPQTGMPIPLQRLEAIYQKDPSMANLSALMQAGEEWAAGDPGREQAFNELLRGRGTSASGRPQPVPSWAQPSPGIDPDVAREASARAEAIASRINGVGAEMRAPILEEYATYRATGVAGPGLASALNQLGQQIQQQVQGLDSYTRDLVLSSLTGFAQAAYTSVSGGG